MRYEIYFVLPPDAKAPNEGTVLYHDLPADRKEELFGRSVTVSRVRTLASDISLAETKTDILAIRS